MTPTPNATLDVLSGDTELSLKCTAAHENSHTYINSFDVEHEISMLKNKKSGGPDGISVWFLKLASNHLSANLLDFFNTSLWLSYIPKMLKKAIITPIPKVNTPMGSADFRPILVTSITLHLMEHVIIKRLICQYLYNGSSSIKLTDQYGFRPRSSCEMAIIHLLDLITGNLAKQKNVYALFLDVSKAFDTISHEAILKALMQINLEDCV